MVVVEVKSADSAKLETEINKIKIDKELIEKKHQLERDIEKFTQELTDWVSGEISWAINRGDNYTYITIYNFDWQYKNAPDFDKNMKLLCQVFTKAGYKASYSYYSRSWQHRSGKVCMLHIEW